MCNNHTVLSESVCESQNTFTGSDEHGHKVLECVCVCVMGDQQRGLHVFKQRLICSGIRRINSAADEPGAAAFMEKACSYFLMRR